MNSSYETVLNRVKSSRRDWIMNILTFIFPFLSVVAAFAFQKIYPIGDRIMLTVDSYHQYVPFLIEFRNKVIGGRSLFFSWNGGLGMEYFAAFSNYSASPLNLLCLFFTAKTMPVFVAAITAVRAGLSSLFMSWFLVGEDEGRRDYITTAFACAYALCGWFCTEFWNIMWCDALFLLPLVLIGLRRLFTEGKYVLYVLSLALLIFSNYYTGFFICLFLVFFAPIYYFFVFQTKNEPLVEGRLGAKTFFLSAMRFVLGSILAGGIAAVTIVPTYIILQNTSAVGADFPKDYTLTGNLFDFLGRFMVAANPNIRDGMANVYTGITPVLMVPLFFAAEKTSGIKLRHKIGMGFMLLLMYLSFSNRTLDFIWHGFHFPNQIPYRQSFLMSFIIIYVGFKTIRVLKSFKPSQLTAVFVGGGVFLILFEKFGSGQEGYIQILISILFVIIEGIILKCTMTGKKSSFFYETMISVFMAIEMVVSCCVSVGTIASKEGFPMYKSYAQNYDIIKKYADEVEGSEGHLPFERTEVFPNNICNIQSVYDVKGFSVFSSTVRETNVKFIRNFGFHNNNINSYRSAGMTRVTATLFGVRNFLTAEKTDSIPTIYDPVTYLNKDVRVLENKDALSVGYMVPESALDFVPDEANKSPFEKTNALINSFGIPGNIYVKIPVTVEDMNNTTQSSGITGLYSVSIINSALESSFTVTINSDTDNSDLYLYLDCGKNGSYSIAKYDSSTGELISQGNFVSYRYYQTVPVGLSDGSIYKVTFKFTTSPSGAIKLYSAKLNTSVYEKMVSELSKEQLNVTSYDDTSIKGTIDTKGGLLLMSVAYNEGFKLLVDGKVTEITPLGDSFVAVKLAEGTHTIELYYVTRGFSTGVTLSVVCLAALIIISLIKLLGTNIIKRRNEANLVSSKTEGECTSEVAGEVSEVVPEVVSEVVSAPDSLTENSLETTNEVKDNQK